MLETCSEFLQQFLSVFFCPLSLYTLHCIFFSCSLAFFSIGQRCFLRNIFLRQSHHTQRSKNETEKTNTKTPFARGTACCSTKHSRFFDSVGMDEPRTILILLRFKSAQRDGKKLPSGRHLVNEQIFSDTRGPGMTHFDINFRSKSNFRAISLFIAQYSFPKR